MNDIRELYFEWLVEQIDPRRCSRYSNLLSHLFDKEFTYDIPMDGNRYEDGIDLRYQFGRSHDIPSAVVADALDGVACSVLEMMVALSFRCEHIMSDSAKGNQTPVWFWDMIDNLGLSIYEDRRYDYRAVDERLDIFLERRYGPDGVGGLFTIHNPPSDIRGKEIWCQMMWYLDEL